MDATNTNRHSRWEHTKPLGSPEPPAYSPASAMPARLVTPTPPPKTPINSPDGFQLYRYVYLALSIKHRASSVERRASLSTAKDEQESKRGRLANSHADSFFCISPEQNGTHRVTWSMPSQRLSSHHQKTGPPPSPKSSAQTRSSRPLESSCPSRPSVSSPHQSQSQRWALSKPRHFRASRLCSSWMTSLTW